MTESVAIRYGKNERRVRLPIGCKPTMIRKPAMPQIQDFPSAIRESFRTAVGCPPLEQLARSSDRVCIVICDVTRPVPNGPILSCLVHRLMDVGVPTVNITILIATGLHRPNLGHEMLEVVGDEWVWNNIRVENHYARDPSSMVHLGTTATDKIPVFLNRHLVESDLRIVVGLVEPHFMAGYSGGRKVIAPGVAGEMTIRTFHNYRFMANPNSSNTNLENNPLHRGQLEILDMLGSAHAVNVVIDEARNVSFVNFGTCCESHLECVEFVRRFAEVPIDRKFKALLTSAAGYPLDKTYYQTIKGMVAPTQILETGGRLVIASECTEGLGSAEFRHAQTQLKLLGQEGFLERIQHMPLADPDAWQTQMLLRTLAVGNISLFSEGLSGADRELTCVSMIDNIERELEEILSDSGDNELAVIPEGPYVIPVYRPLQNRDAA
ncbi:MAG: nickel-dependent lactate racemase [Pirellula sp.]|jgi:nickel-dependent lactate racemase|nr:nickel-dependent lactate racemase [Pirellula sp.]